MYRLHFLPFPPAHTHTITPLIFKRNIVYSQTRVSTEICKYARFPKETHTKSQSANKRFFSLSQHNPKWKLLNGSLLLRFIYELQLEHRRYLVSTQRFFSNVWTFRFCEEDWLNWKSELPLLPAKQNKTVKYATLARVKHQIEIRFRRMNQ